MCSWSTGLAPSGWSLAERPEPSAGDPVRTGHLQTSGQSPLSRPLCCFLSSYTLCHTSKIIFFVCHEVKKLGKLLGHSCAICEHWLQVSVRMPQRAVSSSPVHLPAREGRQSVTAPDSGAPARHLRRLLSGATFSRFPPGAPKTGSCSSV